MTVNYTPIPAEVPVPVEPSAVIIDTANNTQFSWTVTAPIEESEIVWNDGSDHVIPVAGSVKSFIVSGGTFTDGIISWKVRSRHAVYGWSAFSSSITFTAASKPATPVVTTTGIIITALPTLEWTATDQVVVNIVLEIASVEVQNILSTQLTFTYDLAELLLDFTDYDIKIRVKNIYDLWSEFGVGTFNTVFIKPTVPILTGNVNGNRVEFSIDNGVTPNVDYNQLQMLENSKWVDIQKLGIDGFWNEYDIMSDTETYFKLLSFSPEGGYSESIVSSYTVIVNHTHLITADFTTSLELLLSPSKGSSIQNDIVGIEFAGREKTVAVIGTLQRTSPDFSFEIDDPSELNTLRSIVLSRKKVLIRDNRKRLYWGFIGALNERDINRFTIVGLSNFVEVTR